MKRITLLYYFFMAFFLATAQAQVTPGKLSHYTKSFLSKMNQADASSAQKKALYQKALVTKSGSKEYVSAFIYLADNAETQVLEQEGVKVSSRRGNIVTAQVPVNILETVAALPEVKYLQMGTPVQRKMNKARVSSNVDKVQAGTAPLSEPYFGKNVVIGIIDNGFEYGHPNFYNKEHTEYRIKKVWDQNAETGPVPSAFNYGTEYSDQNSILAAAYDMADNSHGTHVTGIAAGADNSNGNTYYGIAGEADIVLVSFSGTNVSISDGIKYIYDYATSVGKPCVINLSLGIYIGPHDGTSTFDQLTDEMQGKGRLLVGAAGNEGNKNIHASKLFNQTDTIFKTFCEYNNIASDIWGEVGKDYKVQVCIYDTINKKSVYISPEYSASATANESIRLLVNKTTDNGARGYIYLSSGLNPLNNKPNVLIESDLSSITAGNCLALIIKATEGTVNAWYDDTYCNFSSFNFPGWSDGDNKYSIGEIGGTGKQIVSVGAYVSGTSYTDLNNDTYNLTNQTLNDLATFSSKGPTLDGRMKPEITAPGSLIASSVSSYDTTEPSLRVKATTIGDKAYYYGVMAGTSMSTPYVTGVLATWLQVNPDLTPDEVKSILQKTSINDDYTGAILPNGNSTWGYGKIDAFNGLIEVIKRSTSIEDMPLLPQSILMYSTPDNQNLINFLFTQGDTNVQINVFNVNGQKLQSKKISAITSKQEETINLGDLPKGLYLIKITGNKLNEVFKASTK